MRGEAAMGKDRKKEIECVATDREETFYIRGSYSILDKGKILKEDMRNQQHRFPS